MRIVAGAFRGRTLIAPPGSTTRPTADRVRQATFDIILHAHWGGRSVVEDAIVLDMFAGTGAFGLEALSRGAAHATFVENDRAALAALRTNIQACRVTDQSRICVCDAFALKGLKKPATLVFLDPPYGRDLVWKAMTVLGEIGGVEPGAVAIAEIGRGEAHPLAPERLLAERAHGAARILIWRV